MSKIKKNVLTEAKERYQQILEYTFLGGNEINEEGDDEDSEQPQGDGTTPTNPNRSNQEGDFNIDDENQKNTQDGGVDGFNPQENVPQEKEPESFDGDIDDDVVLNIDDLTSAQQETESQVGLVDNKIDQLLSVVDKLETFITKQDQKMNDIQKEIETRNPTPLEKLELRAKDSYPFNVTTDQYWKEKEATSNYRVGGNDEEKGEEYVINQSDVEGDTNWRGILDNIKNSDMNQTLQKIFN